MFLLALRKTWAPCVRAGSGGLKPKNTRKRINVSEVGGLWRGKQGDTSPQCRKACGEIVKGSKMVTNMPKKYCIGSVKAWKHHCFVVWFFFFSLVVVASQGVARMRCKMAAPVACLGIH